MAGKKKLDTNKETQSSKEGPAAASGKADGEALRESEERYRTLFQGIGDGVLLHDTNGVIIDANEVSCNRLGYDLEELLGMNIEDIVDTESSLRVKNRISETIQSGETLFETIFQARNGKKIHCEINEHILTIKGVQFIQSVSRDITERKLAEAVIDRERRKYAGLVNNLKVGIYRGTPDGKFIEANPALVSILEVESREELLAGNAADVNEATAILNELNEEIIRDGYVSDREFEIVTRRGRKLWVSVTVTANRDSDGNLCFDGVLYDITERKRAEEALRQSEAQLRQAHKMEAVGRLAGGVAHDFNNMLSVIIGNSELAMLGLEPDSPLRRDFQGILRAAQRSADLTRQLLAFARRQTVAPLILDINETVANMHKMLQRLIGEDIDLVWKPGHDLWKTKIDPAQIDQILANLCVNARDAIAGVGNVTVETENVVIDAAYCEKRPEAVPGEYVMLAVSDDGCGMDGETLEKIFEPFFTTKETSKGTGLGLATVYGIVKQNNGFINVYSEIGKGSIFRIYLPGVKAEAAEDLTQIESLLTPTGTETVMIVEDEPAILNLGKRILENLGYKVLTAETPNEAIGMVENHTGVIHLLLTDVVMPEMNGRELAEKLSAIKPGFKIIFMSGYTANAIAHHGVLEEGVRFVQKPFSLDNLARKVREALDG